MTRQLYHDNQLDRIHRGARRVLAEMGMRVENRACLEALERFGARVDYPRERAAFGDDVIDRVLEMVRSTQGPWTPSRAMLGADQGIGIGGTCPFYFDDVSGEARRPSEADCIEALKIVETSGVAFSGAPVYNADCPPKLEAVRCLELAIETLNHVGCGGIDLFFPEQIPFAVELGRLFRNDPCWFLPAGNCPTSPLIVGKTIADLAVAKAPYAKFYAVPTMPIAGANAPVTPAGTAVIAVAEILGGYALAKALNGDTPVGCCALTAKMDMRTGEVVYVSPEVFAADIAVVEVFQRVLKLPCDTFGVYIDAKTPGRQAIAEKLTRSLTLGLYGKLTGFEGTLDKGRVFSATQLMLDIDLHRFFAAATADPVVDDDLLGVEEIVEIGFDAADYLAHEHTLRHMRESWHGRILDVPGLTNADERTLLDRARQVWRDNLRQYEPPRHSVEFLRDLHAIGERARRALM